MSKTTVLFNVWQVKAKNNQLKEQTSWHIEVWLPCFDECSFSVFYTK